MDQSFKSAIPDIELIPSRRCFHCQNGAQIECLLCLKTNVRPVPCFCSKHCYRLHWNLHKTTTTRSLSTIKSTSSLKTLPSYRTTTDFSYSSVHPHSTDDLYLQSEGVKNYSPDFHPLDEAQETWMAANRHYHDYMFRQYLMSGASNETMPHS